MKTNENKIDLAEYNVLGLEASAILTDKQKNERQKIMHEFNEFLEGTVIKADNLLNKFLYGNLTRQEAETVWMDYSSIEEAMAHIPGRLAEKDLNEAKRDMVIFPILENLQKLIGYGKEKKIYQNDFISFKRRLLELLFEQFGSHDDISNFENTLQSLKKAEMIPETYSFEEMTQYCSLGRWY
ncbi:MAG: hypothetical protein AB1724_10555 [Thermodesulfobacteriota bacterium]